LGKLSIIFLVSVFLLVVSCGDRNSNEFIANVYDEGKYSQVCDEPENESTLNSSNNTLPTFPEQIDSYEVVESTSFSVIPGAIILSDVEMLVEKIPELTRLHLFGGTEGKCAGGNAGFDISFNSETYQVVERNYMLRISPVFSTGHNHHPVFMEILHISDTTKEDILSHVSGFLGNFTSQEAIRRPSFRHVSPTERFPFDTFQLVFGSETGLAWDWNSPVVSIYIGCDSNAGTILATTQNPLNMTELHGTGFSNILLTLQYEGEAEAKITCDAEPYTIENMFKPKSFVFVMEGSPLIVRCYPRGEIGNSMNDGFADFVIYFEEHQYTIEQQQNMLVLKREFPPEYIQEWMTVIPTANMKITQIPTVTTTEAIINLKAKIDFINHMDSTFMEPIEDSSTLENFPFYLIRYYEGEYDHSTVTNINIRCNGRGGVFIITSQYYYVQAEWFGGRFRSYLRTLEIL